MASRSPGSVVAEAVPSGDELVERARDIAATLVDRQAETEERGFYAEDTHDALRDAGLYRMTTPERYGGYGADLVTFSRVIREIARGCPSTGWMFGQSINHTITLATFFPEQAQETLFADPDFISPATIIPGGTARRADDGGWIVNGTFRYSSGAPYSTHMVAHVIPEGESEPMLFVIAASEYERLDDWGAVLGLKGSGSHTIEVENGYVPESWAKQATTMVSLDPATAPGLTLHDNPVYWGSAFSFYGVVLASNATGMARGAVDEYERLVRTKNMAMPPFGTRRENPDYQRWLGYAYGKVIAAEAAMDSYCAQWMDLSRRRAWRQIDDLRLLQINREVIANLNWDAMQTMIRTCGSSELMAGKRMERVWRDFTMAYSHGFSLVHDMSARNLALQMIGDEVVADEGYSGTFEKDDG